MAQRKWERTYGWAALISWAVWIRLLMYFNYQANAYRAQRHAVGRHMVANSGIGPDALATGNLAILVFVAAAVSTALWKRRRRMRVRAEISAEAYAAKMRA